MIETGSFYELDNSNRTTVAGYDYYSVQAETPPSFVNYNIPTVPQAVSSTQISELAWMLTVIGLQ